MPELDFVISAKHAPDAASEQQHGAPRAIPTAVPTAGPSAAESDASQGRARCGSRAPTPTATTSRKCK